MKLVVMAGVLSILIIAACGEEETDSADSNVCQSNYDEVVPEDAKKFLRMVGGQPGFDNYEEYVRQNTGKIRFLTDMSPSPCHACKNNACAGCAYYFTDGCSGTDIDALLPAYGQAAVLVHEAAHHADCRDKPEGPEAEGCAMGIAGQFWIRMATLCDEVVLEQTGDCRLPNKNK